MDSMTQEDWKDTMMNKQGNLRREIHMMDDELEALGVVVIFQGPNCVTVAGDHHDFMSTKEVHAYLTGCLVFVQSRPFDTTVADTEASQPEGS